MPPFARFALTIVTALTIIAAAMPSSAEDILRRGNGYQPRTMDVQQVLQIGDTHIQWDLFEGLLAPGPDGRGIPGVAERWEVAGDGTTYTFHLRPTARWSDGTPVTAADFVFAWRRLVAPKTAAPMAQLLWGVRNGRAISAGTMPPESLGVRAPDNHTFVVELEAPDPGFTAGLVLPMTAPLPRHILEVSEEGLFTPGRLVSNGAFVLAEAAPQSHHLLRRNERYWDAANVKLDGVRYEPTDNADTELRRFRAGELDTTFTLPSAGYDWIAKTLPDSLRNTPGLGTVFLAFNLTHEPWRTNANLRAALALAIDRDLLASRVLKAGQRPFARLVPPGLTGYDPPPPAWARLDSAAREAEARRLYAAAGYGADRPLEVEVLFGSDPTQKLVLIAVADMWKRVLGVKTVLLNQEVRVTSVAIMQRTFRDAVLAKWLSTYDDPHATFLRYYRTDGGVLNPPGFANPAYDALLDAARRAGHREAYMQQLAEAEDLLLGDHPVIPLFQDTHRNLVSPRVTGWIDNPFGIHPSRFLAFQ